VTAAEWISLAAAIISAVATVAAWFAAASARDSAKQTRIGQQIEVNSRRLAALHGLYGLMVTKPASAVEGLSGRLDAIGYPLLRCRKIADDSDPGVLPTRQEIEDAAGELRDAMLNVNSRISDLERELTGRKLTWLGCALPPLACANAAPDRS
jgi:hypothetical protein